MVAAAEPQIESNGRKSPGSGRAVDFPVLTIARVRNLYLGHCLGSTEIAKQTGLKPEQIRNLVARRGWTKLRAAKKEQIEQKAIARTEASINEIVEAVAMESETLALGTLNASHGILADIGRDPDAARNLQALSQSAKNFVGIFRQARNLDAQVIGEASTVNVMFVGSLPKSAERATINVSPSQGQATHGAQAQGATIAALPAAAIEVSATPVT